MSRWEGEHPDIVSFKMCSNTFRGRTCRFLVSHIIRRKLLKQVLSTLFSRKKVVVQQERLCWKNARNWGDALHLRKTEDMFSDQRDCWSAFELLWKQYLLSAYWTGCYENPKACLKNWREKFANVSHIWRHHQLPQICFSSFNPLAVRLLSTYSLNTEANWTLPQIFVKTVVVNFAASGTSAECL